MVPLQFPSTLGMDFSGIIKEIDSTVSSFDYKNGNEVYGQDSVTVGGTGAFVEIAITDAENIALKSKTLSYGEAAALPLVGVSAWQALAEIMHISRVKKF